jgi:CBS domain-containing protein/nucleotide-binding universal stress UspA family protein
MTHIPAPIGVGIGGSAASAAALRWAVEEGEAHGVPVWAVHVVDPRNRRRALYAEAAGLDADELDLAQSAEAAGLIERNAPLSVRRMFEVGNPAVTLLRYADSARMLVLGYGEHHRRHDLRQGGRVMERRLVQDVMSRDVATIHVGAGFRWMVRKVLDEGVGALPVVDATGRVVGVVSETDLIAKQITGIDVEPRMWFMFTRAGRRAHAKRPATAAARLMSEPPVVIGPGASLARAAYLMTRHNVRHLPVVDADGRPLGIVSRGDLLREYLRDDDEIRTDVLHDVLVDGLDLAPDALDVEVLHGEVTLSGFADRASTAAAASRLAGRVPGVVRVTDLMKWRVDDRTARSRRAHAG